MWGNCRADPVPRKRKRPLDNDGMDPEESASDKAPVSSQPHGVEKEVESTKRVRIRKKHPPIDPSLPKEERNQLIAARRKETRAERLAEERAEALRNETPSPATQLSTEPKMTTDSPSLGLSQQADVKRSKSSSDPDRFTADTATYSKQQSDGMEGSSKASADVLSAPATAAEAPMFQADSSTQADEVTVDVVDAQVPGAGSAMLSSEPGLLERPEVSGGQADVSVLPSGAAATAGPVARGADGHSSDHSEKVPPPRAPPVVSSPCRSLASLKGNSSAIDYNPQTKAPKRKRVENLPNGPHKLRFVRGKSGDNGSSESLSGLTFFDDTEEDEGTPQESIAYSSKPHYTTIERWMFEERKRKYLAEQSYSNKHKKTEEKIIARFQQLKVRVLSYSCICQSPG